MTLHETSPLTRSLIPWVSVLATISLVATSVQADDIPAPTQKAGNHSAVSTNDGSVRDDELVDFICETIADSGYLVKDVKLFVNSCYGGGLLDDMERAFGPGGLCEGIPWVAGSASDVEQIAKGHLQKTVDKHPGDNLGSTWTDGLFGNSEYNKATKAGVVRNGSTSNNVLQDLKTAVDNNAAGPKGVDLENSLVASGNGGDKIQWHMADEYHEAIVFGGANDAERHDNNIENVEQALKNIWPDGTANIQSFKGGSRQDLFDAIETAASRLDQNTQFVLYIDDHGESKFDFDEAIGAVANVLFDEPQSWDFRIPDGWFEGMWGNYFMSPQGIPDPGLWLDIVDCQDCSAWNYYFNGLPIPFPSGNPNGSVGVPIPFWQLVPGKNYLEIFPPASSSAQSGGGGHAPKAGPGSLMVSRMELTTGPISELEFSALQPGQSAAFYDPTRNGEGLFVELLDNERALVYMFTYDNSGQKQAWMLGLGYQTGEGIIVMDFQMPVGATFGPGFDPDDVDRMDFGSLFFHLPACGSTDTPGNLFIYPTADVPGYQIFGSNNYVQLTSLVSCDTGVGSANSPLSGSWFDPTHNGEGIILEVFEDGTALVQWFTYDDAGNQMWIQGTGTFDGQVLTVENLYTTGGTVWGGLFDADAVVLNDWGSLMMTFTGCGMATVEYVSTAGFGEGTLNMQRITNLMGITCVEP